MNRFTKGDVVHHALHGRGVVLGTEDAKALAAVEFDSMRLVHPNSLTPAAEHDLTQAKALLAAHGYAFRIYGPEDVHTTLDLYAKDEADPVDTVTYRDEITRHVMEGDDWPSLSDATENAEDAHQLLWNIVAGTHHDHPEWFPFTRTD